LRISNRPFSTEFGSRFLFALFPAFSLRLRPLGGPGITDEKADENIKGTTADIRYENRY
jgi:hypothetical protein